MKFFAVALGFCAIAAVSAVPAIVNTGHSAQFRSQDSLGNYAFGYNEDHATGGTFRRETGSPGIAQGSYGLRVADGRVRVVNYVADGLGFRANIQTNEPGVEDQDPASVLINKAAAIVAPYIKAPVVAAAPAPLAIQQSIEAPIVQKYESGPAVIDAAPVVQQYEQAPIIQQRYEPAPIVQQQYEPAPIIEQAPIAPIVQQQRVYEPSPVISTYTTKTYAAPAPILSAPQAIAYQSAPAPLAYAATKGAPAYGLPSAALLGLKSPLASPAFAAKTLSSLPYIKKK
ncbi:hypothetical protein TYRP_018380 [Tyrophagus putrescentiae]|nr:hypothetical protein TYRP_018380 [Tyrophagus putrescentiae]